MGKSLIKYENRENVHGDDIAATIADYVNWCHDIKEFKNFADELANEHRTIQQAALGLIFNTIVELAKTPENRMDARNEYSIGICKKLAKVLDEEGFMGRCPCI